MSGPPPEYYLTPQGSPQTPAYSGPGFAASAPPAAPADPAAPAWQDPWAAPPANTNPLIAAAMGTGSISYQFSGPALYALVVGVLGIGLPFFTPFYFRVLPLFGVYSGIRALMSGRVIGGSVGIGLNVVAGIISLLYMGFIHK
jgi:hypothetical protein